MTVTCWTVNHLELLLFSYKRMRGLLSKETAVLRLWGEETNVWFNQRAIRSAEGLTLETSALESLYDDF